MNAIRHIVCSFIFSIGMYVFSGSAMAFDLGGVLKQVEKAAQQMGVDQNTSSNSQAAQGRQISAQGSISPGDSPRNAEEYCQRISSNPSIIQLAEEIRKMGKDSDEVPHTYLDNEKGDLEKWVADNLKKFEGDRRLSMSDYVHLDAQHIKERFNWVRECYAKNSGNNSNPFIVIAISKGGELVKIDLSSLGYGIHRGKIFDDDSLHPKQATLLAFLFPGVENVISSTSPDIRSSFGKAAAILMERRNEERNEEKRLAKIKEAEEIERKGRKKQAEIEEDKKRYGGLTAVYTFRTNPAIAASYNKCLSSEREFRSKKASGIEANAKNANTVAEQNKMNETASRIRRNIEYIAHGNCIYRLNVGLLILEGSDEMAAVAAGYNMGGREKEDLNAKYVPAALKKVAGLIELPAEKFEDTKVVKPFTEARDELDKLRPATRRQQEEIEAQKMMLNILQINIITGINDIVTSLIEGKVQ